MGAGAQQGTAAGAQAGKRYDSDDDELVPGTEDRTGMELGPGWWDKVPCGGLLCTRVLRGVPAARLVLSCIKPKCLAWAGAEERAGMDLGPGW